MRAAMGRAVWEDGMKKRKVVEFEPGDVVCLKSGGPAMTVSHSERITVGTFDGMSTLCHWFECFDGEYSAVRESAFVSASLELAE